MVKAWALFMEGLGMRPWSPGSDKVDLATAL